MSRRRAKPDAVEATSQVFAGTINGGAAIEIEVTRRSNESALAKVVKMVSEAETQKSPTQRFTDRFERVFVPAVLALSFILLFAWVVVEEPFRDSFYRDGGAGRRQPLCARHRHPQRGPVRGSAGRTRRRAGERRSAA